MKRGKDKPTLVGDVNPSPLGDGAHALSGGSTFRSMMTYHAQFLLLVVAGWVNRQQQDVIDYL